MRAVRERGLLWARDLVKRYDHGSRHLAVDGVDLDVPAGSFVTLLGPSGCGKSTTLRMLIGLERPTSGTVGLGDLALSDSRARTWVPPNSRNFGMVFQSYAIWPHMTVRENVAFPLRVRRKDGAEVDAVVDHALARVDLAGHADRSARRLSGGQQQRVAIARALAQSPEVLLLDEPLSNLDASLRRQMRVELKELQRELGVTTVYVTHDQVEAVALSDEIVVMRAGRVEQVGPPQELHDRPASLFVAEFLGGRNLVPARIDAQGRVTVQDSVDGARVVDVLLPAEPVPAGAGHVVCPARRVRLLREHHENSIQVTIRAITYEGDDWDVSCSTGTVALNAVHADRPAVHVGDTCFLHFPAGSTHFVSDAADSRDGDTSEPHGTLTPSA